MAHRPAPMKATACNRSTRVPHADVRPSATDALSIAPRVLLALFAATDLDALVDSTFQVLRTAVRCDFASAFYQSTGSGLMKERDSRGRESGPAFMRRYLELTPALPFAMANPGIKLVTTQRTLPRAVKALRQLPFYREIMQPQGWRHAVALCFWGHPPAEAPVFVTSAYRREGRRDFSAQDITHLERVHAFIDCAVRRVQEHETVKTARNGVALAVRDGTQGFAILDRDLLPMHANQAAHQLCAAWVDGDMETAGEGSPAWCLPPVLGADCLKLHHDRKVLLRADPDATGLPRPRLVLHPRVPGLTASITMVCPNTIGLGDPAYVIELERHGHGVALDALDQSSTVLEKLTESESAVAMVLADGFSNQEIADRLGKTVDAVKFLLHRIYQKTGIPSRAALVAVLRAGPTRSQQGGRT
jgi:DNA-binding CsgD family transcriptional regulator